MFKICFIIFFSFFLPNYCEFKIMSYLCTAIEKSSTRPDGGIGRRAGLKHQWSNPSRFDPGSGYNKKVDDLLIINLLSLYTLSIPPAFMKKYLRKLEKTQKRLGLFHSDRFPNNLKNTLHPSPTRHKALYIRHL